MGTPSYERLELMFATNNGPFFGKQGPSFINLTLHGVDLKLLSNSWKVVTINYIADKLDQIIDARKTFLLDACIENSSSRINGIHSIERHTTPIVNSTFESNLVYTIKEKGWVDTQIYACSTSGVNEVLDFNGTIGFHNPYGYLPAVLYGLLPFSGFLTIGYIILDLFFLFLFIKYRDQVIGLQYGILVVLVMGTLASGCWFYSFIVMNSTGVPLCCPYPVSFVVSFIFGAAMRTLARILLLTVCLGYGIVRERLQCQEIFFIFLLSIGYFVSGVADHIERGTSNGYNNIRLRATYWAFIELICNLTFVMWIYGALESIVKELSTQHQTAKLQMYKSLACTLAGFVFFFSILTTFAVLSRFQIIHWPIEWEWAQLVAWPILNFTVSAAICSIWRPTQNSSQYALHTQLPSSDDGTFDDMHDDDDDDPFQGIEMVDQSNFTIGEINDVDNDEMEEDEEIEIDLNKEIQKTNISKELNEDEEEFHDTISP